MQGRYPLGSGPTMNRMNREQFFAKLAPLDEERLRKALWTVYWRGTAKMRERIEAEIDPDPTPRDRGVAAEPVDPHVVLAEVHDFVSLARSGAYMAGDRRVSPKERTRWRFTFRRLVADARDALRAEELAPAAAAVEALIDLACEVRGYDYFRSEDPVEAAKVVVSDEVALLWSRMREHSGFPAFAEQAAPQLVRWESRFGWTRTGFDQVAQKESSLASVLASMLQVRDAWMTFADHYLEALDRVASGNAAKPTRSWRSPDRDRNERTEALADWHLLLLDRLIDDDTDNRVDRLTTHPALGGPELTFLQAWLAHRRGDVERARDLIRESLTKLPGHDGFLAFATEIGAPLPPRAQQAVNDRARMASGTA
ncbi:hypothetical protein BH23ACT10_BH23ACT10_37130 [soil metagenome]